MLASEETKRCAMCAEPIHLRAVKCKHCGSYQHWLGRINITTTILSLVIALISVVGLSAPTLKSLFTPSAAAFRLSDPVFARGSVSVTATNYGAVPATLGVAFITIPQRSMGQPYIFDLPSSDEDSIQRVGPGETKQISFVFDHDRYDAPEVTAEDRPCTIAIYDQEKIVSCDEIRFLVSNETTPMRDRKGLLPEEGPSVLSPPTRWQR